MNSVGGGETEGEEEVCLRSTWRWEEEDEGDEKMEEMEGFAGVPSGPEKPLGFKLR